MIGRREREQIARKAAILESARHLFEEKSFELTTVDEIAERAELGKGTIYSYFKSKEEIYITILEEGLDILMEKMYAAVEKAHSAEDALHALFDAYIQYQNDYKNSIASLFLQVDIKGSVRLGDFVKGLKKKAAERAQLIAKVLCNGISGGEFKEFDVERLTKVFSGLVLGIILQYEMGQINEDLQNYKSLVFELILEGIKRK